MNRRYALLWLVALATTVFAQSTTEAPNQRLRQLEESLQKLGYKVGYTQTNIDALNRRWVVDMSVQQGQERLEKAIDAIRVAFTEVSKEATESQQYESHKNGTDTIEYALGFMSPEFKRKRNSSINDLRLNSFFHADEFANFFYRKNEEGRDISTYAHTHVGHLDVAPEDMKPFNTAAFEAQIRPVLKSAMTLKGAYSSPILWRHDKGYKKDTNEEPQLVYFFGHDKGNLEYANEGLHSIYYSDGVYDYGLATGTRYFIPAQYKDEANKLFLQLQSMTHDYVNQHRDQYYDYFHTTELPYPGFYDRILTAPLSGYEKRHSPGKHYFLVFVCRDDGLHILSFSGEGEIWIPNEWYKVKSYINGKLVYLKDVEKDVKRQAIADAVAARQWHIDIRSMNTLRYGSRSVTPDFYLELRGDTLRSYLPYLGQVQIPSTLSPSIGLNFEAPVLSYNQSRPKSKYTQIDIDVRTREDSYHYVIEIDDAGEATIRVRSQNSDPISFDGTMVIK